MKKFFDLFKLRSGRLLGLSIACIVSGTLFSYNNCGEVYKAKQSFRISSSCSQEKVVSLEERDQLLSRYHSPSDKQSRLRCPGFFAVLDDDAQYSVAQNKMAKATDGCNQNGLPQEPELPEPSDNKDEWIRAALGKTRPGNIETWVKKMSDGSLWPTRYHASSTNNKVAEWIKSEFETLAGNRSDIRIELIDHSNTPQKSVEVMIEGSGQNRDKYVVLGGHQDSILSGNSSKNPDTRSPGADDNASGVASLMEAFRVLIEEGYRPDATLVIYTYAAEEIGLVGSQEIARTYSNQGREVLGVMQIDMSMYSLGSNEKIFLISDFTSSAMNKLASELIEVFLGRKTDYMACGYACSDHASWTKYNFPSFMPAEQEVQESVSRIHSVNDIVDSKMDSEYAAEFSRLAVAFAVTLAGIVN